MSLAQCVPNEFRRNATEFLNESNILGRWFDETCEQVEETDSSGHVIHFEPIKELWKKYKDSESYDRLPRKQQDELTLKRFKGPLRALLRAVFALAVRSPVASCCWLLWSPPGCSPPTSRPQAVSLTGRRRENGQTRPTGCRAAACFSRRCSSASGSAAHPSHTPPRPS